MNYIIKAYKTEYAKCLKQSVYFVYNNSLYSEYVVKITDLKAYNGNLIDLYIDFKFICRIRISTVARYRLFQNKELTDEDLNIIINNDFEQRLYEYSLKKLASRPASENEIKKYLNNKLDLIKKNFSKIKLQLSVDAIINKLKKEKMIDDSEFVDWWVENRQAFRPRSKAELRHELASKGVDKELIIDALENIDEQRNNESILNIINKKKNFYQKSGVEKNKINAKIIAYLQRRGYNYYEFKDLLKNSV